MPANHSNTVDFRGNTAEYGTQDPLPSSLYRSNEWARPHMRKMTRTIHHLNIGVLRQPRLQQQYKFRWRDCLENLGPVQVHSMRLASRATVPYMHVRGFASASHGCSALFRAMRCCSTNCTANCVAHTATTETRAGYFTRQPWGAS